jgi:membrane-associated protease RseP (regulator of RpoE activity)
MLNKKIMSLALAALTTASLAIPALAEDNTTNTTTVTGAYEEIAIAVTVPTTGTVSINPYGLPVELKKSESSTKTAKVTGQQIVTQPMYISNEGDVALTVGATVTTTAKNFDLVDAKPADTVTDKQAYINLEMVQSANKSLSDDTAKDKIIDEYATDSTWTSATQLTLSSDDVTKEDMATLAASKVSGSGSDKTVTYNVGSIVLFRLAGNVVTKPDTAWTTSDSLTAKIAFTFTPATTTATAEA